MDVWAHLAFCVKTASYKWLKEDRGTGVLVTVLAKEPAISILFTGSRV